MIIAPFDTETTGLPFHRDSDIDKQPRIIEFAGLLTDGKQNFDTLEFICNPHIPLEAIITKITGLTDEDVCDKPDFGNFVPRLKTFFGKAQVVIAHNLSFDKAMLRYDLKRRDMTLEDINWPAIEICTVEQTYHMYGRRMKLEELYAIHCGEWVQKHRALDDVSKLADVCQKMGVFSVFN